MAVTALTGWVSIFSTWLEQIYLYVFTHWLLNALLIEKRTGHTEVRPISSITDNSILNIYRCHKSCSFFIVHSIFRTKCSFALFSVYLSVWALAMKTYSSVLRKDIIIRFNIQVYHTTKRCMVSKLQNYSINRFKMAAINLN